MEMIRRFGRAKASEDARAARFEALVEEHRRRIFKVAHAYCRCPEARDDLVQEIYLQLWRAFPRYDPTRPAGTWLYRIALNVALSWVRREALRARHTAPLDPQTVSMPAPAPADARVEALYERMDTLEPLDRALLLLTLDGCRYSEIADVLGMTPTHVATKLSRLKQRLRADLTKPIKEK